MTAGHANLFEILDRIEARFEHHRHGKDETRSGIDVAKSDTFAFEVLELRDGRILRRERSDALTARSTRSSASWWKRSFRSRKADDQPDVFIRYFF